jgi:hypothetical protein
MMFRKDYFPTQTKLQISELRGGKKHNFRYFVGISETVESDVFTDILDVKLLNQMASQRYEFPDGYEPFLASYGTARFCLRTMSIPVPRLKLCPKNWLDRTLAPES